MWLDLDDPDGVAVSIRTMPADASQPSQLLRPHFPLGPIVALPDGSLIAQVVGSGAPHLLRRGTAPTPLALTDVIVAEYGTVDSTTNVWGYLPPS